MKSYSQQSNQIVLHLPLAEAWEIMRDLSIPHNYVPGVVKTRILSDQKEGQGTLRRVYSANGDWVEEAVTEWNEGSGFLLSLVTADRGRAPAPFKKGFFRYELLPPSSAEATGTCICRLTLYYKMRWGMLGRLLALLLRPVFKRRGQDLAERLKHWYEKQGKSATEPKG